MFSRLRVLRLAPMVIVFAIIAALAAPFAASADGFIIIDPPVCDPACPEPILVGDQLDVREHHVDVTIENGVAETRVDQTFHNPNDWVAEGTYLFPVPKGAAIGEFRMWVDGQPVEAKLLEANEARETYEEIVRKMRDPALLEFVGENLLQASVFPIPPGEDRRIELAYGEVLPVENGLAHYRYGLKIEQLSDNPIESASIRVAVASEEPLRAVYSPSHDVAIDRPDETHATIGWEATDYRPDTDFDLYYSVSPDAIGASIVSSYDPAAGEGYFLFLASPGLEAGSKAIAKDVILVLDTSGSMEGDKIVQAREALVYVLDHLGAEDRFSVIEFSTGVRAWESDLSPASDTPAAVDWVQRLEANGGTDINQALLEAMATTKTERPTMVIFLTDGLPTEGETDISGIMRNVAQNAPENVRLFAFGVGDDVDTFLLDGLAEAHHGRSFYVRPGEPLNEVVSSFYASISAPVLTNLDVDWGSIAVEEMTPDPLPDLFAGGQLVVLGKYENGGDATITLTGDVNGERSTFSFANQSFSQTANDGWIARLWATRRIGYLLNQIRLNGEDEELVQSVIDLSVRFGIVTPYTSYLLTEEDILSSEGRTRVAKEAVQQAFEAPAPASGSVAVDRAQAAGGMAAADAAAPMATSVITADGEEIATGDALRFADDRAFVFKDGVWTDTTFDPDGEEPVRITFLSDEYFALLAERPELAAAFALGDQVIVVSNGTTYQVVP